MAELSKEKPGEPENKAIERSRLGRASRYETASQLLKLAGSLEPDVATSVMDSLDKDGLDALPHWCLMDDTSLRQFQRLIGALFLAPALKRCIDGSRLAQWQSVMGKTLFEGVIVAESLPEIKNIPELSEILPEADESLLFANGASILLSTLTDTSIQLLMGERFTSHHGLVNTKLALEIHVAALKTLQQITDVAETEHAQVSDSPSVKRSTS